MVEPRLDVLLIGETQRNWWHLIKHLEQRGCDSWCASTNEKIRVLLGQRPYRLVLSTRPVTEQSPLMKLLRAPGRVVFYSFPIEDGFLWFQAVPEILRGPRMSTLRPDEFMRVLDNVIANLFVTPSHSALSTVSSLQSD